MYIVAIAHTCDLPSLRFHQVGFLWAFAIYQILPKLIVNSNLAKSRLDKNYNSVSWSTWYFAQRDERDFARFMLKRNLRGISHIAAAPWLSHISQKYRPFITVLSSKWMSITSVFPATRTWFGNNQLDNTRHSTTMVNIDRTRLAQSNQYSSDISKLLEGIPRNLIQVSLAFVTSSTDGLASGRPCM